jgi:hypothetical protein
MRPYARGAAALAIDDLETYRRQFEAIEIEARELLDRLTEAQLSWQRKSTAWSIGDCLEHLIVTGRHSLAHVAEAMAYGRERGMLARGPFRYRLLDRWLVWLMGPAPRLRLKAPRAYRPGPKRTGPVVVAEFVELQREFCQALKSAHGLDLARIKVRNPVSRWIRFSLGQEFAFNAAHERRHLWQVRQTKAHSGFPTVSSP